MRRRAVTVAGVAGLTALALALGAMGMPGGERSAESFTLSGSVGGLFPGHATPLELRVRNPSSHRIRVLSITVEVGDASDACPASNLHVSSARWPFKIRPRAVRTVSLRAKLIHRAPEACSSARFPLTYSGRAVRP